MPYYESTNDIERFAQTLCVLVDTIGELLDKLTLICLPAIGIECISCSLLLTKASFWLSKVEHRKTSLRLWPPEPGQWVHKYRYKMTIVGYGISCWTLISICCYADGGAFEAHASEHCGSQVKVHWQNKIQVHVCNHLDNTSKRCQHHFVRSLLS